MKVKHVVFLKLRKELDENAFREWSQGLDGLPRQVEGMLSLCHGANIVQSERAWDYAIVADFASVEAVTRYADHEAHLPLVDLALKLSTEMASVDFHIAD